MKLEDINTVTAEDIVNSIVETAEKHGNINQALIDNFKFSGKSLQEWMSDVAVPIPAEVTPENFREAFILWARKFQKVNYYYSMSSAMYSTMQTGGDNRKSDLVSALMEHYSNSKARRPAAATLERMAESYMADTVNTRIAARIVRDFWRDRRDTLIEVRKALEAIGVSMNMEMKYHEHG